jgi:protein-disulfide isomerase
MNKRFLIILVLCVAGFLGLVLFNKKEAGAPDAGNAQPSSYVQGEGTSGVTLAEYGDFQCPACAGYEPVLEQVKAKYGDQIKFQFSHFPLVSIHPNAMSAHRAAEAAGRQDKFWEMHDLLYERQSAWSSSNAAAGLFEGYARELGLDMDKYRSDVASSDIQAVINADMRAGQNAKVTATPAFLIDGKKVSENPRDAEGFYKLIDDAIASKKQ